MSTSIAGDRAVAPDEREQVSFEPAIFSIAVAPARHDAGGRAPMGVEARERIGERCSVFLVNVIAEVRAVQVIWREAEHAANGLAAEHVAAAGRELPDPILRGVDD